MAQMLRFFLFAVLCLPSTAMGWPGNVLSVTDGDTLVVAPAGAEDCPVSVRLYGIDAPECGQPHGDHSTRALQTMLSVGDLVEIVQMDIDRYGRVVALVIHDRRTINLEMVRQGHAWVYEKYCKLKNCDTWRKFQREAAGERRGMWEDEKPIPPWKWKKNKAALPYILQILLVNDRD